jgi:hypothetical protein
MKSKMNGLKNDNHEIGVDTDNSCTIQPPHRSAVSEIHLPIFHNPGLSGSFSPIVHFSPSQTRFLWRSYMENVDPLLKLLHVPTLDRALQESDGSFNFTKNTSVEIVMLAASFAALATLNSEDVGHLQLPGQLLLTG